MYFHVIVGLKEKNKQGDYIYIFETDIDDANILAYEIVKPYLEGITLNVDGKFIKPSDIRELKIKQTEKDFHDLYNEVHDSFDDLGGFIVLDALSVLNSTDHTEDITRKLLKAYAPQALSTESPKKPSNDINKVFIVHGHDGQLKSEVARFVEKLGLHAIILHEQANQGQTVIEKLESNIDSVNFAIVLYTPDDVGNAKGQEPPNERARQNVIFEHGYLIAKLSRKNVTPLVASSNIELPSDIGGMVYVDKDNWEFKIAKEMKAAGYNIDLNKLA